MNQNDGVAALPPLCGPTGGADKSSPAQPAAANAFTPGPWEVGQHPAVAWGWIVRPVLFGSRGRALPASEGGAFILRSKADADLISSAPELYDANIAQRDFFVAAQIILADYLRPDGLTADEALTKLLETFDGPDQRRVEAQREAALAKARGEAL